MAVPLVIGLAGSPPAHAAAQAPNAVVAAKPVKSPPTITALTPASGPTVGGTPVSITGTGFTKVTAVTFGANPALITGATSSTLTVITPANQAGDVRVTVTASSRTSAPATYTYVPLPAPPPVTSVASVAGTTSIGLAWTNPDNPTYAGVTIRRAKGTTPPATPGEGVLVGDVSAPATKFIDMGVKSGSTYSYALFAHDAASSHAAAASVSVTALKSTTTPIVTGLTPTEGPTTGGTPVTITGAGLGRRRLSNQVRRGGEFGFGWFGCASACGVVDVRDRRQLRGAGPASEALGVLGVGGVEGGLP
ncbi:MAG: IPT/TIG domain-containing protein [Actinomycetales bacterium]|nr:IPT/TIG domain-containing protein [Actinomycetales bacterium]